PIYDPATTTANPNFDSSKAIVYAPSVNQVNVPYVRQQFMGCDGKTANVICPSDPRLANSLAPQWLKYLPSPNLPGPVNNYQLPSPVPDTILSGTNYWLITADQNVGSKHHIKET